MLDTILIMLALAVLSHLIFTLPARRSARRYLMGQKRSFGKLAPKAKRSFYVISLNGKMKKCFLEYTRDKKIILKVDSDHSLQLIMAHSKVGNTMQLHEFPVLGNLEEQQEISYDVPQDIKGTVQFSLHNQTLQGAEIIRFSIENPM